jgi:CubicO group peptidase (beta-lactamase class C family)
MLHPLRLVVPILFVLAVTSLSAQTTSKQTHGSTLSAVRSDAPKPFLMRNPTLSRAHIAFQLAGAIWTVPQHGGAAVRLTSDASYSSDPAHSPDGSQIAFTRNMHNQWTVDVMPSEGEIPRHMTFVCQSQQIQQHIRAVESGLLPAVVIAGQQPDRMEILAEMKKLHIPAVSIAVIHKGKIEWAKGYGVLKEGGAPVTPASLFQAASISKSFTAMAALRLVQDGKLSLDAPIQTELKSWKLPENNFTAQHPVTLRELLSHTAGINVHGFEGYAAGTPVPTLIQILNGQKPANSDPIIVQAVPGQKFDYSGGGFTIVQQSMIDATGKSFPELLQTTVLKPSGMRDSAFQQPIDAALLDRVAMPFASDGKPIPGGSYTYPELAAAGLWTTPSDLARWIIEVQRSLSGKANHILTVESLHTMLPPDKDGYALGIDIRTTDGKRSFSHDGGNVGYRASYIGFEDGDGAVIMTDSDSGDTLITEILRAISHEYGWPNFKPIERTMVTLPLAGQLQYVGKFSAKDVMDFSIATREQRLVINFSDGTSIPLLPSSPTLFFVKAGLLQIRFDSQDSGVLLFGKQEVPFSRVQ